MIREEIIKSMSLQDAIQVFKDTNCYGTMDIAKSVILKALEQEPVLDKVRAEIENTMEYQYAIGENQYAEGFEKSLEIIDKYKAESEDKK